MVLDWNPYGEAYLSGMEYLSLVGGPGTAYVPLVFSHPVSHPVVHTTSYSDFSFKVTEPRD